MAQPVTAAKIGPPSLQVAACSDVGRVREGNEDRIAFSEPGRWAVLADGMGGHRAGEVAAGIAVEVVGEALQAQVSSCTEPAVRAVLVAAVAEAHRRIRDQGAADRALYGMGTTVVAVAFVGIRVVVASVGDSRLYRFGRRGLERLTRDHTVLQAWLENGMISEQEARESRLRGQLIQALGASVEPEADIGSFIWAAGERFLLCSDGLTDMLDETRIGDLLSAHAGESLENQVQCLVAEANRLGGVDNISVILIEPQRGSRG